MTPDFTFITACLHSEKTIPRMLESVVEQEVWPGQWLFVDGGSEDDTRKIVRKFAETHPEMGIRILLQEDNTGIYGAWNQALKMVGGTIVGILNSDDWLEAGALKSVKKIFESNPEADIVYGSIRYHSEKKSFIMKPKPFCFFPVLMPVMHPACFVKKEVYDKVGSFDEKYRISADYDFIFRCKAAGCRFLKTDAVLTNMTGGGTANSNRNSARRETCEIGCKHSTFKFIPQAARFLRTLLNK